MTAAGYSGGITQLRGYVARVGASRSPRRHPIVLSLDEKTAIQALDRLDPVLPFSPGYLHRRPMLLTTSKPLSALGDVLHDGDLAEAILDCLLELGVHFALHGRSYRTRRLSEEDTAPRRAKRANRPQSRVTELREKWRPEFREPTHGTGLPVGAASGYDDEHVRNTCGPNLTPRCRRGAASYQLS